MGSFNLLKAQRYRCHEVWFIIDLAWRTHSILSLNGRLMAYTCVMSTCQNQVFDSHVSRKQGVRSVLLPVKSDRGCQLVESKGDSLLVFIITLGGRATWWDDYKWPPKAPLGALPSVRYVWMVWGPHTHTHTHTHTPRPGTTLNSPGSSSRSVDTPQPPPNTLQIFPSISGVEPLRTMFRCGGEKKSYLRKSSSCFFCAVRPSTQLLVAILRGSRGRRSPISTHHVEQQLYTTTPLGKLASCGHRWSSLA